ncbi:hypothetical protein [Desulfobacula sp.]|uniref:hypothetical protein n=1 Tax=Desulfobacula sp. TaxID=2593537 RepID=UPI0026387D7A|nr:hypothetical protein [Desulfobacula sp.]
MRRFILIITLVIIEWKKHEWISYFIMEVDACRAEAYLETDVNNNVRFYEKFGFEVIAESDIFNVKNRYMLRISQIQNQPAISHYPATKLI